MVEQEAVNFEVASSSLAGGAKIGTQPPLRAYFDDSSVLRPSQLEPPVRAKGQGFFDGVSQVGLQ